MFPVLHKLVWLLVVAPAALALFGMAQHGSTARRTAFAVWLGAAVGALAASVLWMLGYVA